MTSEFSLSSFFSASTDKIGRIPCLVHSWTKCPWTFLVCPIHDSFYLSSVVFLLHFFPFSLLTSSLSPQRLHLWPSYSPAQCNPCLMLSQVFPTFHMYQYIYTSVLGHISEEGVQLSWLPPLTSFPAEFACQDWGKLYSDSLIKI